jgi:hypothetical protein
LSEFDGRLRKSDYSVVPITWETACRLVTRDHYARGGSNSATYTDGLILKAAPVNLLGVAWWIPPTRDAAEATWDGDFREVLALSRFIIVEGVPKNAATFLLARSVQRIRRDGVYRCLVSYADEAAGHVGTMYRAAGWEYLGLTASEPRFLDSNGRQIARKAGGHTRTRAEMEALGYVMVGRSRKHKFRLVLPAPKITRIREGALL